MKEITGVKEGLDLAAQCIGAVQGNVEVYFDDLKKKNDQQKSPEVRKYGNEQQKNNSLAQKNGKEMLIDMDEK